MTRALVAFGHDYADAYMTAYRWLFRHCPPWRWLLNAGLWLGSGVRRELDECARRSLAG